MAQLARASQALPASCTIQRCWLRHVPSPAGANITRSLCTDQALKKVLEDVARRVSGADPTATALPPDTALPPGATLTSGPKVILRFTCTHEGPTSPPPGTQRTHSRTISKRSYEEGVVLVRCGCCNRPHLIADNLGWFGDKKENIEGILAERGEEVQRICGARTQLCQHLPAPASTCATASTVSTVSICVSTCALFAPCPRLAAPWRTPVCWPSTRTRSAPRGGLRAQGATRSSSTLRRTPLRGSSWVSGSGTAGPLRA